MKRLRDFLKDNAGASSGEGSPSALRDWGIAEERVDALFACGALGRPGGDDLRHKKS